MKTILQIVEEHIAKLAEVGSNPAALQINAHEPLMRMQKRFEQDPALVLLSTHYAKALMVALPMLPPELKTASVQSVIVQVIQDWEDVHREFEQQLAGAGSTTGGGCQFWSDQEANSNRGRDHRRRT